MTFVKPLESSLTSFPTAACSFQQHLGDVFRLPIWLFLVGYINTNRYDVALCGLEYYTNCGGTNTQVNLIIGLRKMRYART